ncbi:plasmid pRiA4b ORF-3 family protein [Caballeronia sp. M23-90]
MVKKQAQIWAIKLSLREIKPEIWRRIEVASTITLADLHKVIQAAMGWMDSHLHDFDLGDVRYGMVQDDFDDGMADETGVRLDTVCQPGARFIYNYDFGDGWEHLVVIEKAVAIEPGTRYPRCTAGRNACPPEDCGGPWGYADMLKTLAGKRNAERAELIEWLGGEFDPRDFDLAQANRMISDYVDPSVSLLAGI